MNLNYSFYLKTVNLIIILILFELSCCLNYDNLESNLIINKLHPNVHNLHHEEKLCNHIHPKPHEVSF